jgi:hypothetical protein
MKLCALLAASLLFACTLTAQESEEPSRGPDGSTRVHVGGIEILPVAGRPFSGRDSIDWTRNLEDGTVIATHLDANLARDGQGRIYREHVSFVPANSDEQSKRRYFTLSDPVAHTRTTCVIVVRRCAVTGYYESTSFTPRPTGPFDDGKRNLSRESLGSDVIDGLNVIGTRETISINPGVLGNNQPLVSTREFWYSPDLQVNLSVTRKDPREGTQVIHVVDLSRSEPDPAMFQVPNGYVVRDLRLGSAKTEN